jgi:dihydroflavonol-4-reductase
LDGSIPDLPRFGFNVVDVRDIATSQLLAMTTPSAAGQRFIGSCDFYWMADIAKILKQGLGDKAPAQLQTRLAAASYPAIRARWSLGE